MATPTLARGIDLLKGVSAEDRARLREWTRAWTHHPKPVVFAGAGLSAFNAARKASAPADARLKTWEQLARDFLDALRVEGITSDLPRDPLRLAELLARQTSRTRVLDLVEAAIPDHHFDPGIAHQQLAKLPWAAVVTTNYDNLIERAYEDTAYQPLPVVDDTDLTRPRRQGHLLLIKMHGDLRRRQTIVISEDDYRCYEDRGSRDGRVGRPGIALKVRQLLLEHPVLFLGYGLADPNVDRLLGWVRDIVGRLQLPAIAVVHGEPRRAERDLWSERGIHLVHVDGGNGGDLTALLDAIWKERSAGDGGGSPSLDKELRAATDALCEAVSSKGTSRVDAEAAAMVFAQIAATACEVDGPDWTRIRQVTQLAAASADIDWSSFLEKLSAQAQAQLARALAGSRFVPRQGVVVDLRVALFAFAAIREEERVEWFLKWVDDQLDDASDTDLGTWLRQLRVWRNLPLGPVGRTLDRAVVDVVFRRADAGELLQEASRVIAFPSARDFCRAGSALLALDDREGGAERFRLARDVARTADERHAALVGLSVCDQSAEVIDELASIVPEQAPAWAAVEKLRQRAAEELLATDSADGAGEASLALVQYCRRARRENWPVEYRPVARAARRATKLLLDTRHISPEDVVRALSLRIEFGLAEETHNDVKTRMIARASADSAARNSIRRLLLRSGLAPASRAAQQALAELAFDFLTDDEINEVVTELVRDTRRALPVTVRDDRLEERWECLVVAKQRLTTASVIAVADVLPAWCDAMWWHFPHLALLSDTSILSADAFRASSEFAALVEWVIRRIADSAVRGDWYARRPLLHLAGMLHKYLSADRRRDISNALNQVLADLSTSDNEDNLALDVLEYFASTKETPREKDREISRLVEMGARVARSSLSGLWAWTAEKVVGQPGEPRLSELRRVAVEVGRAIEKLQERLNDPFGQALDPVQPLKTLVATVAALSDRLTEDEVALIERVGRRTPGALGLLGRAGIGIDDATRERARDRLVSAAVGEAGRGRIAAARAIVEWCTYRAPDAGMQELLVSLMTVGEEDERRALARSVWDLRPARTLSDELWGRIASRMLDTTQLALGPVVRAQAARSLLRAAEGTPMAERALHRLRELTADPDTLVRRAASQALAETGGER